MSTSTYRPGSFTPIAAIQCAKDKGESEMADHDVIVVGAGHNGLTLAAYLTKAGLDVCVLERQEFIGGACATREITVPGFRHDPCGTVHAYVQANPLIKHDELGLRSKYGLEYIAPEGSFANAFPDETCMLFYGDLDKACQSIAQFSQHDAESYRRLVLKFLPVLDMLMGNMFRPPPPYGVLMSQLDQSSEGQEILRHMGMSAWDIIQQHFEHEKTRTAMLKLVSEPICLPEDKGTGLFLTLLIPFAHRLPYAFLKGGSGMLSEALTSFIRDNGGTVRTGSEVKKITVQAGRAKSVVLCDGEEIGAHRAVVANLDPRLVFPGMVLDVPEELVAKVNTIHDAPYSGLLLHLALNEAPKWKAGEEMNRTAAQEPLSTLEHTRREFDELRYARPLSQEHVCPLVVCPTLHDPSRAPKGKHCLYLFQYQPYALEDGGPKKWDEIREQEAEKILHCMRQYCTNMGSENIIAQTIETPMDFVRWNPNLINGSLVGPTQTMYQLFDHRPIPELGRYRTHIVGLYLCGQSFHPGGGVSGGGRAAVQIVMEDLGIDFEDLITK